MAKRRMISEELMISDEFLDLPGESQLLYLHLLAAADDDGFLRGRKRTLSMLGYTESVYTALVDAGFLLVFPSGAAVIAHWPMTNKVPKDRYTPTRFQAEAALLTVGPGMIYILKSEADGAKPPASAPEQTPAIPDEIPAAQNPPEAAAPSLPQPEQTPEAYAQGTGLPLLGGGTYTVKKPQAEEWQRLYPLADLPQELRNMRGWLLANPEKQKTADNIERFINNWLSNAHAKSLEKQTMRPVSGARGTAYCSRKDSPPDEERERLFHKMYTTVPKLPKKEKRAAEPPV